VASREGMLKGIMASALECVYEKAEKRTPARSDFGLIEHLSINDRELYK
jgi:hypothetical protein